MHRTLPLVVVLLVAGCIGGNETPPAQTASADDPTLAANEPPMDATAEATASMSDAPPVETPISYSGSTPQGACAAVGCHFEGGSEDFHVIDIAGQPLMLVLSITYGEQAPGHEFFVSVCHGDDEMADCSEYETGASPIAIEYDLSMHPADSPIGVSVGSVNVAGAPAGLMTFAPSDFSVEGKLVSASRDAQQNASST